MDSTDFFSLNAKVDLMESAVFYAEVRLCIDWSKLKPE